MLGWGGERRLRIKNQSNRNGGKEEIHRGLIFWVYLESVMAYCLYGGAC